MSCGCASYSSRSCERVVFQHVQLLAQSFVQASARANYCSETEIQDCHFVAAREQAKGYLVSVLHMSQVLWMHPFSDCMFTPTTWQIELKAMATLNPALGSNSFFLPPNLDGAIAITQRSFSHDFGSTRAQETRNLVVQKSMSAKSKCVPLKSTIELCYLMLP